LEVVLHNIGGCVNRNGPAQLSTHASDCGIWESARNDPTELGQVAVAVERESMHSDAFRDSNADRSNLAIWSLSICWDPDTASTTDARRLKSEVGAHTDQ
jgi:hypothetical protein